MKTTIRLAMLGMAFSGFCSTGKNPNMKRLDRVLKNEIPSTPVNSGTEQPQETNRPSPQADRQLARAGIGRAPGPSILDIRYHRDEKSGKFIIDEVNPDGPFKHLKGIKESAEEPRPHF